MMGVPAALGRGEPEPWLPMLMLGVRTGTFLGGMLGTGGVPYWARRARMFGEPEIEELSLFWGVPGRISTGLVGVDMVCEEKTGNSRKSLTNSNKLKDARDATSSCCETVTSIFRRENWDVLFLSRPPSHL